jgi:hypothetical protein
MAAKVIKPESINTQPNLRARNESKEIYVTVLIISTPLPL